MVTTQVTPSPHRFLKSKSKPADTTPKPSSSLRFQQNATQSSSSQQFASVPRFNFSSTQKTANENATPATQFSSPLSRRPHLPPAFSVKNREDIEETSSGREDDEPLQDNSASHFALSTQPTSKRRRPNPSEAEAEAEAIIISSDSPSPTSPPTTPLHPTFEEDEPSDPVPAPQFHTSTTSTTHQPPRFVLPLPKPISDTTAPSIPSRPPLILPPTLSLPTSRSTASNFLPAEKRTEICSWWAGGYG
ncbi:hypothetical protein ABVK25_011349 [Lepraria finkii]|uniref:Uncharacterized protein n=1 Tax=Lepraria finkii TaxID=1340010 RepID=A0ABR4AQL2_9LECA